MANEVITGLQFRIGADIAELKAGLQQAQAKVDQFGQGVGKLKTLLAGAFTIGAITAAATAIFEFATGIDDVIGKLDDLGQSFDLALNAGKAKAIADVFETDIDGVIKTANATATQFGISMNEALDYLQKGMALAGTDTTKYLKSLEAQAATFNELGGTADEYFAIVTNGYRNSTNWEAEIKAGRADSIKQFSELTSQFNDGQLIQQELINSSAELNSIWAETFDGTGDLVDQVKIGFNNLAIGAIKGLKDIANWFIDLYNKSMAFRGVIQLVVLNFKTLWETIKLVFQNFFTILKGAGELLKAVFTGSFSEIPGILRKYFNEAVDNVKGFAANTAENFKTAYENTVNAKPIELFKDGEAHAQGVKAAKNFKAGYDAQSATQKPVDIPQPKIDSLVAPVTFDSSKAIAGLQMQAVATDELGAAQLRLNDVTTRYGDAVTTISEITSDTFTSMFDGIISGNKASSKSFKDAAKGFKEAAKSMIASALAQAISQAVLKSMSTAKNPIVGLVLAGIASAGVLALFSAIPAFATSTNGLSTKAPYFFAGEDGSRKELVVNTGGGSRVYNHSQTKSMLDSSRNSNIQLSAVIRGEDLYLMSQENLRRRGNSI